MKEPITGVYQLFSQTLLNIPKVISVLTHIISAIKAIIIHYTTIIKISFNQIIHPHYAINVVQIHFSHISYDLNPHHFKDLINHDLILNYIKVPLRYNLNYLIITILIPITTTMILLITLNRYLFKSILTKLQVISNIK